jgi:hypothetical protein
MRDHRAHERVVLEIVEQAARVAEQLADRDRVAVGQQPRQDARDRLVEPQPPLVGELQHDHGDERLRNARDAEAVGAGERNARPAASETCCARRKPDGVSHDGERAGSSVAYELPRDAVERRRLGRRRRRRQHPGDRDSRDGEQLGR